jgi:nitroimidazol reductase NimA-like FMN-containing flavoprotein (pyridoxamine 5'-phosphate oxidase superfamily)
MEGGGGTVPNRELSASECAQLLSTGGVGRVALCTSDGPQIYPVNYTVVEGAVMFRTSSYSALGTALVKRPRVAFEVDHLEPERQRGWSVVASGTAEPMDDPDEVAGLRPRSLLVPWAEGTRNLLVRMSGQRLTGRRVGDW